MVAVAVSLVCFIVLGKNPQNLQREREKEREKEEIREIREGQRSNDFSEQIPKEQTRALNT